MNGLSKFNLQHLLRKDKETRDNIIDLTRKYSHNILLIFNMSESLHVEFTIEIINDMKTEYNKNNYDSLLSYLYVNYGLDSIINCSGYIFKNDKVGVIEEMSIINIDDSQISVTSCIDNTLEENVITSNHLVSLSDRIIEV